MGARGPAPVPTPLLLARGSRKAEGRDGEPHFDDGLGTCPKWMSADGRAEWKLVVGQMRRAGIGQKVDRAALVTYCEAWGEFAGLCRRITAVGDGAYDTEPAMKLVRLKNEAAGRLLKASDRFGFSPAARARLKAPDKASKGGDKDRFFSRGA